MAQCFRTCLPMQGTPVWSLVEKLRSQVPQGKEALGPQPEKPSCLSEDPAQPKHRQQTCQGSFVKESTHSSEKALATRSSTLAWKIPWVEGAWWAAVYGVAQSQTRLKRLSSSSHTQLDANKCFLSKIITIVFI